MKQLRLAFVDLETTGLDPFRHEIFEIGIVLAEQTSNGERYPELKKISEHEFLLRPRHPETADPKGLEVSHFHDRDWTRAIDPREALQSAAALLRNAIFIAQNVAFDWSFLQKAGNEYGVEIETVVHYHKLDLASMVFATYYREPQLQTYSLREMCEYFGVTNASAHTALSDARAAFMVAQKVIGGRPVCEK